MYLTLPDTGEHPRHGELSSYRRVTMRRTGATAARRQLWLIRWNVGVGNLTVLVSAG
jgi:hypothetical protein